MKELNETAALMSSNDYKERFAAEYYQEETRYLKLKEMVEQWYAGTLKFTPTCPRELYCRQLSAMLAKLQVFVERAELEGVRLDIDENMAKIFDVNNNNQVIMSKQTRVDIDNILARVHSMEKCRETSLVITKLQEAIMWMGMNLKRLKQHNPYPDSMNTESMRIEPTADGLKM